MAACVAVNEHGKLVAEELWNGFDEDFQEAVQKYFTEKWNMPKKEDVVSEIIEKSVPVPDNSAQDYSDVPVYYEPFSYAKENDEVDLYRTSCRLNSECNGDSEDQLCRREPIRGHTEKMRTDASEIKKKKAEENLHFSTLKR